MISTDEIGVAMQAIQTAMMGGEDGLFQLFRDNGVDPESVTEAAQIMLAVTVAMKVSPEDGVISAFQTGFLVGILTGHGPGAEEPTVGDMIDKMDL